MNTGRTARVTADQLTTGSVTSADGTPIGYLRAGHGPAVVVLESGTNWGRLRRERHGIRRLAPAAGDVTLGQAATAVALR